MWIQVMALKHSRLLSLVLVLLLIQIPPGESIPQTSEEVSSQQPRGGFHPYIYLVNHDPLSPWELPEPSPGEHHFIVTFSRPLTRGDLQGITRAGFHAEGYIPEFSYLVSGEYTHLRLLEALPGVERVSALPAKARISPDLLQKLGDEAHLVRVQLFEKRYSEPASDRLFKVDGSTFVGLLSGGEVLSLIEQDDVMWVEEYAPRVIMNDVAASIIGARSVWENLSMNGSHQLVTVCDTGLDTGNLSNIHLDFRGRIYGLVSWPIDSSYSYWLENPGADDGCGDYATGHGTHVAGSVLGGGNRSGGRFRGMASEARLFLQAVEQWTDFNQSRISYPDGYYLTGIPSNISLLFQQAYDNGSRIHTNSWGSTVWGAYTADSRSADWFTWTHQNFTLLFAGGNSGPYTNSLISPGTAKNVITVGASENYRPSLGSYGDNPEDVARFSSRGPTDDGRLKPDVLAPGTWIISTRSSVASGSGWGVYNQYYVYMGGTSMATPITAGSTALLREYLQYHLNITDPSLSLLKGMLIASGDDPAFDPTPIPNNVEGWGRINLTKGLVDNRYRHILLDNMRGVSTGENLSFSFHVNGSGVPLKVILTWSDYPSLPSASVNLVNDLDLEVRAPNGTLYYGNDFTSPYNDTRDRKNNVEGVILRQNFSSGNYTVTIRGYNIPYSPQPFSVVILGDVGGTFGTLLSDGRYYSTDGGKINITLLDPDMSGSGTLTVHVNSTSDPTGVNVVLREVPSSAGVFTALVTLKNSTAGSGDLLVSHLDRVNVLYRDGTGADVTLTVYAIEPPKVRYFSHTGRGTILSLYDIWVVVVGTRRGVNATVKLLNLSYGTLTLHDDGAYPDRASGDGNYSGALLIANTTRGVFPIQVTLWDGYLPPYTYDIRESLRINTSLPRAPKNLTALADPRGNRVNLSWDPTNETDISHYSVYINTTDGNFTLWGNTSGVVYNYSVFPLTDGVEYLFYVTAVDTFGNESGPSEVVNATPRDIVGPQVEILSPVDNETIRGNVTVSVQADEDCVVIRLFYYRDLDGNGLPDDGEVWREGGNFSYPGPVYLQTVDMGLGVGGEEWILLMANGVDEANNTGPNSTAVHLYVDNTPPSRVWLDSPPDYTNETVLLLTAHGEEGGWILVVRDYPTGEIVINLTLEDSSSATFVLPLHEGFNTLHLEGYDWLGNGPTLSESYTILRDTSPPVIRLFWYSPVNLTDTVYFNGGESYDVGGENDTGSGIVSAVWYCHEEDLTVEGLYFEHRFPSPGWYNITFTLTDRAGNSNSTTVMVRVRDNIPPTPRCQGNIIVKERTIFTLSAEGTSDNVQGIFIFGNFTWRLQSPYANYTFYGPTVLTAITLPGNYSGNLTVTDAEGNTAWVNFYVLVLDITPPEVEILSPGEVEALKPFTLLANATDNDPAFPEGAEFFWWTVETGENHTGMSWNLTFPRAGLYTVKLKVKDRWGNSAEVQALIRCLGDGVPPEVVLTYPREGASEVDPETSVMVVFSEEIFPGSLEGRIKLYGDGSELEYTWELNGTTLIIHPDSPFPYGAEVTVELREGMEDLTGMEMLRRFTLNFTIRPRPRVVEVYPPSDAINISVTPVIRVVFNRPMNQSSLAGVMLLSPGGAPVRVERQWQEENLTLLLIPLSPLYAYTHYTIHVGLNVTDTYGTGLEEPFESYFVTGPREEGGGDGGGGGVPPEKSPFRLLLLLLLLPLLAIFLALLIYVWRRRSGEIEVEEVGVSPFGGRSRVELTKEEKEMALKKFMGEPVRPLEGEVPSVEEEEAREEPSYEEELEEEGWEERPVEERPMEKKPSRKAPSRPPVEPEEEEVVFWDEEDEGELGGGGDEVVW